MARKIKVKLILELREQGMSRNQIAKTRHVAKLSVCEVFDIAQRMGVGYKDIEGKNNEEVYRLFYPDKYTVAGIYEQPGYPAVHEELKKTGVTLKLLWQEYLDSCRERGTVSMGYSRFCKGYTEHIVLNNLTNHLEHKPGIAVEVDWSGPSMSYLEEHTGEVITVYLFVATLPYSQYSYVEPTLDMKQDAWLKCHVNMYAFFGGSPVRTKCDNLKTGVISHPREGEIVLNDAYEALGSHYMSAIMPTPVRRPKAKASVEGTVGKIATAVIARLRNVEFHSFDELKAAVAKALADFNAAPFQKREGSRLAVFEEVERAALRPLPTVPYEIAEWVHGRSVGLDFHVRYGKNHFSCPFRYARRTVDLRITERFLEVYCDGERIATHDKQPDYVINHWATLPEHMPEHFNKPEWDDERIRAWAANIGRCTAYAIGRIFDSVKIKEQGYNSCLSVLKLSKTYGTKRLETACEMALDMIKIPRYRHLKAILSSEKDIEYEKGKKQAAAPDERTGYIRGAEYYGGEQ
jgi:transposase